MPGRHLTRAEKALRTRRALLESIARDTNATAADRLKALDRLEKLERAAAKGQPKPKPAPPEDLVSAEVLDALEEPPAPTIINPPARPVLGVSSEVKTATAKSDAQTPISPVWLTPSPAPPPPPASTAVSWATIWGEQAVLSDSFKDSTWHWRQQEQQEAAQRRRAAWEAQYEAERKTWTR